MRGTQGGAGAGKFLESSPLPALAFLLFSRDPLFILLHLPDGFIGNGPQPLLRQLICACPNCELCGGAALPGANCDKAALLARAEQEHSSASRAVAGWLESCPNFEELTADEAKRARAQCERLATACDAYAQGIMGLYVCEAEVHKLRWLRLSARGEKHGLRWQVLWQLGLDLWKSQAPRAATQAERALLELEAMECFEQVASERTQLARDSLGSPRTI
eukprot:g27650.t1